MQSSKVNMEMVLLLRAATTSSARQAKLGSEARAGT